MAKAVSPGKRPPGRPAKSEPTERLSVEMPKERHRVIKMRAADLGMSVKDYALHAIAQCARTAKNELAAQADRAPIPGSWHEKRIVIDASISRAAEIKGASVAFGTMREFILRCIEIEMRGVKPEDVP